MRNADLKTEIERLERWFREVCPAPPDVERSAIRRRVRVALDEQWLATRLIHDAPPDLADRAKSRVREALRETTGSSSRIQAVRGRGSRLAWWVGGGLSAAAAVGLAVVVLRSPTESVGAEAVSFVSAFELFDEDGFDGELARLRDVFLAADEGLEHWGDSLDADWESSHDGA